ncbi:MAG: Crp/Fnr family transcriptional regulator [Bacteroidota bacterium]
MEKLLTALAFGGILAKENIDYVVSHFEVRNLKFQDHFLKIGQISKEIGFINDGVLRAYSVGHDGEEITKYFIRKNQFVVDLESYYNAQPCDSGVQAVVDAEVFLVKKSVWDRLNEEVPKLYILTKSLSEAALLNKIKDNDFLNYGTAKNKYEEFVKRYPDLALEVPQQYIASYLKITPQSLSRIRKELMDKG